MVILGYSKFLLYPLISLKSFTIVFKKRGIKMIRLSWLISCGIAIFGVMLVQYFFQMKSETGNLGIVGIALVIPFVILCLFITFKYFSYLATIKSDTITRIIYIVFGILFVGVLFYFATDYKDTVYTELGGTTHDKESTIYGMSWLNEKTSVIYFNFYTILIAISTAAFIGYVSSLIRGKKEKELEN